MFNRLKKFGEIIFRLFQAIVMLTSFLTMTGFSFCAGFLVCMGIEAVTGSEMLTNISIFTILPLFTFIPSYLVFFSGRLPDKYKKSNSHKRGMGNAERSYPTTLTPWVKEEYGEIPHFGKMFGTLQVRENLKNDTFHPYVFKDGKKASYVYVNSTDKWVRILEGYLPVDLICGYSKNNNELYTVDGVTIKLPLAARGIWVYKELDKFFKERGAYHETMPQGALKEYWDTLCSCHRNEDGLSRADWSKLRYLWEKNILDNSSNYGDKIAVRNYMPVLDDGNINTEIFKRVLSKKEINKTYEAIKREQIKFSEYLDFKRYINEFSVCNGIELLKIMGQPKNLEGIDFLFDCLSDVDEAYFLMSVDLLKKFPRADREKKIEENARLAFEKGDVVKLAGVLYLAKELDYESEYIKQLKKKQEQSQADEAATGNTTTKENAAGETTIEKTGDTAKKFELDEQQLFGSDEVLEFNPSGVAYLEQE